MTDFLKSEVINWLLEKENPSVRYFTLTELLNQSRRKKEVKVAEAEIVKRGVVPQLLAKQNSDGSWPSKRTFKNPGPVVAGYLPKYKGLVWQLIILAELGADRRDGRIKRAVDYLFAHSYHYDLGAFSMESSSKGEAIKSGVITCLISNMVFSLIRLGYFKDGRVGKAIDWIVKYQRFDDGDFKTPKEWPYRGSRDPCFGKHSCFMGCIKALKALAEIPKEERTSEVERVIEEGAEFFLDHHIYKASHDLSSILKPGFTRFGFPRMYQTDALEIMLILTKLGYSDSRMKEALQLIESKQGKDGRWLLEQTFNDRFQVRIERKGKPSKWITLNALRVLEGQRRLV